MNVMPHTLPVSLISLVGREQEIETLCQLLYRPDVRLVTITGPGGVGKTSLALQVARELSDIRSTGSAQDFADGIYFISLAPISDPTLIIPTIAQILGVTESPTDYYWTHSKIPCATSKRYSCSIISNRSFLLRPC